MPQNFDGFMSLSREQLANLIREQHFPRLGVYIPDGTRRLTLALRDCPPDGPEFFHTSTQLALELFFQQMERFFGSGLWGLIVPLFSYRVLNRSETYAKAFVFPILSALTQEANWLELYAKYQLQVRFYGWQNLKSMPLWEPVCSWMEALQERTMHNTGGVLCLGVGGSPVLGEDAMLVAGVPAEARLLTFYGVDLPRADFILMSGKLGGVGSLPPFVCDGDTALYLMPAPGLLLDEKTWRQLLYDLLFERHDPEIYPFTAEQRAALRTLYQRGKGVIFGLGERHYGLWIARELCATVKGEAEECE